MVEVFFETEERMKRWWRCNNLKCACQPIPKYPIFPPLIEMYLSGTEEAQFVPLHQKGAEFDMIFDIDKKAMLVRDTIVDHTRKYTFTSTYVRFDVSNSQFVNLQGLEDNSLLLTLRMRPECFDIKCKNLRFREKVSGFVLGQPVSKLYTELLPCDWEEIVVHVVIPAVRTRGWDTVALILLSFERVTMENWCCLVNIKDSPPVAGLDWKVVEADAKLRGDEMIKEKGFMAMQV